MVRAQFVLVLLLSLSCNLRLFSQIAGKWTSIDDNSGEPRSVIEITERSGKFVGKVIKIYSKPGEDPDPVCDKCSEDNPRFKQKVISMEILRELIKEGEEF